MQIRHSRWLIYGLFAAAVAGLAVFYYQVVGKGGEQREDIVAHYYQRPTLSIQKVRLKVFYVVPKNRQVVALSSWKADIEEVVAATVKFHRLQLRGASNLTYDIYPQPVILQQDGLYYDTDDTNHGNPAALVEVAAEVRKRYQDFLRGEQGEFVVLGLIYEGTGASGTKGALLLSRTYITRGEYEASRAALFYHEFGHTLGLPDNYDPATNQPLSSGIMGGGRGQPLETNYIEPELLRGLGVIKGQL